MFNFLFSNNYEERKVDRCEVDGLIVDTCAVDDGIKTYETGVFDEEYHSSFVIVEAYETYDQAIAGHRKWVETMKSRPDQLVVVNNSAPLASLADMFGVDVDKDLTNVFPRKVK
jgi:hypothetical protein